MGDTRENEQDRQANEVQQNQAPAPAEAAKPEKGKLLGWDIMVVPDGYKGALPTTNWIFKKQKTEAEDLFKKIEAGTTSIKIHETSGTDWGHTNDSYPGFKEKVIKALKRLMTIPPGRKLLKQLAEGGKDVTIRPSKKVTGAAAGAHDDAASKNGKGSASTVYLDPNLSDKSVKVYDKDGKKLATPVFLALGHELIHASHNQAGTRDTTKTGDAWDNQEEKNTIESGPGVTENDLRRSLGLGKRHGHGGEMGADRTKTVQGGGAGG